MLRLRERDVAERGLQIVAETRRTVERLCNRRPGVAVRDCIRGGPEVSVDGVLRALRCDPRSDGRPERTRLTDVVDTCRDAAELRGTEHAHVHARVIPVERMRVVDAAAATLALLVDVQLRIIAGTA